METIIKEEIDIEDEEYYNYSDDVKPSPTKLMDITNIKKNESCCLYCDKPIGQLCLSKRKRHYETHQVAKKSLPCNYCNLKFSSYKNLSIHLRSHTGNCYSCEYCPKKFARIEHYRYHVKIHLNIKYSCDNCDKSFAWKNSLRNHMKIHFANIKKENSKIYQCNACDKSYNRERDLLLHSVVHTKKKPYKCEKCGNFYFRKSSLERHKRNHSVKKLFFCKLCNTNFKRRYMLNDHSCYFQSYKCHFCKKITQTKYEMENHIVHWHLSAPSKIYFCNICFKIYCLRSRSKHKHIHYEGKIIKIFLSFEERARASKFKLFSFNDVKLVINPKILLSSADQIIK